MPWPESGTKLNNRSLPKDALMQDTRQVVVGEVSRIPEEAAPALLKRLARNVSHRAAMAAASPVARLAAFSAVIVAILSGALLWRQPSFSPNLTLAQAIPDYARMRIGRVAMTEITKENRRCRGVAGASTLNRLVDRLRRAAGTDLLFRARVVDTSAVNVFTMTDHQIVLTNGLIGAAFSPDEVAGVLAHEMGHAIGHHPETTVLRRFGVYTRLKMLVGGWSPEMMERAGAHWAPLRHSRTNEAEADATAIRILTTAGISARPFLEFFDRITRTPVARSTPSQLPHFTATHPILVQRRELARSLPAQTAEPALEPAEWQALRSICS
jgi:predicted Zn-dependent protease